MAQPALDAARARVNVSAPDLVGALSAYAGRLQDVLRTADWSSVACLAEELRACWQTGRRVFLCGNGGSAANAIHLAGDLSYSIAKRHGTGVRVEALPANSAVMSGLANDAGYEDVFALQLALQARPDDVLIVLSGSGNSANIVRALETGTTLGMKTFAVVGYGGGRAKALAAVPIHFDVADMQLSEDLQLVVGHMIVQWLDRNPPA
jgi:D-sedoheptulose 7-phosphate isomerase